MALFRDIEVLRIFSMQLAHLGFYVIVEWLLYRPGAAIFLITRNPMPALTSPRRGWSHYNHLLQLVGRISRRRDHPTRQVKWT